MLVEEPVGPDVQPPGVGEHRGGHPHIETRALEVVNHHSVGIEDALGDRKTNAVQYMIAVCLENDLRTAPPRLSPPTPPRMSARPDGCGPRGSR